MILKGWLQTPWRVFRKISHSFETKAKSHLGLRWAITLTYLLRFHSLFRKHKIKDNIQNFTYLLFCFVLFYFHIHDCTHSWLCLQWNYISYSTVHTDKDEQFFVTLNKWGMGGGAFGIFCVCVVSFCTLAEGKEIQTTYCFVSFLCSPQTAVATATDSLHKMNPEPKFGSLCSRNFKFSAPLLPWIKWIRSSTLFWVFLLPQN